MDIVSIVLFVALIVTAFALQSDTAFYFSAAVAVAGYLIVQQPDQNSDPDERDRFLNHRSANISFAAISVIIVVLAVLSDQIAILQNMAVSDLLHGIMALVFLSYTLVYAVLKRLH